MALLRPLFWLLVFFGILFLFKEPIRNFDENTAVIHRAYISPFVNFVKNVVSSVGQYSNQSTTTTTSFLIPKINFEIPTNWIPKIPSGEKPADQGVASGATTTPISKPISQITDSTKPVAPISGTISASDSSLSINGIVSFTNRERTNRQFPALKNNKALNASANNKLADMFAKQYFEHESPTGKSASDLIRTENYQYIVVGENLALGNFGGDNQVVTAWMNSPGHRANILDPRFQEIGIAVGKGMYKGKEQWIAVQHFAKPLSSCPGPNNELKTQIDYDTADLADREKALTALKKDIDTSTVRDGVYTANVQKYNNLVGEYNTRLEGLKDEISRYNDQVKEFNACAGL